nr:hypothetical protein [Tanacetum cinerariifolium]
MEVYHIPHDVILYHILPRISAQSVCCFKCVSKDWRSFFTSDMFQNKHNHLHADDHKNNHKLLILSKTKTSFECATINCKVPSSVKGLTPTRRPLPPFECITPGSICLLASFHGLVCLGISSIHGLIEKSRHLSTYKYTLSWTLESRVDTKTKPFLEIETHHLDDNPDAYDYYSTIVVKGDCIHVCVKYDIDISYDSGFGSMTCIKLWKLDEYGKMIELVDYKLRTPVYDIPLGSLIPFYLMKNGNWVMCSYENHQIYKVDLKKKIYIKDNVEGKEKGIIYDDFEYAKVSVGDGTNIVDEEVRYIETFVSRK